MKWRMEDWVKLPQGGLSLRAGMTEALARARRAPKKQSKPKNIIQLKQAA